MANVTVPQFQKSDQEGKALQIASLIPGVAPVAAGINVARSLSQNQGAQVPGVQSNGQAMQRRLQDLETADQSLAALPQAQQQQYGPAIKRARTMAEQEAYA